MPKGTASRRPVIFDYIGVLTDPPDDAFTQIEKARGYPPGSVRSLVLGDYDARTPGVSAWHMVETGQLDVAHYVRWLLSRAPHVLGTRPFQLSDLSLLGTADAFGIREVVLDRIRELRRQRFPLALLTNDVDVLADSRRKLLPLDELFDVVVESSAVGLRKPDPKIFLLTCERLHAPPRACVFLDDERENVEAARRLGMHAIHVDDPHTALDALDRALAADGSSG